MKHIFLFVIALSLIASACVKDRVKSASSGPVDVGSRTLIHYFSFNKATDAASLQRPDTSIGGTAFTFKFGTAGYIDVLSMGTLMNARNGADTGVSFRVRNPFYHWTLKLPTTGYKQPILQFAVHRSNSGPTTNAISYTTDGTNYITTGLSSNSFTIGTTWAQFSFDFSSIPGVDDNPNFGVMFINSGDTTGGNNRFDNITLDAYPK